MQPKSTTRTPTGDGPRLDHQGVLYRSVAELVEVVAPELVAGLAADRSVAAIVDETTAELLRRRIGPDADRIVFTDPVEAFAAPAQTMVAQRRRLAADTTAQNGPMVVVGQFQAWMTPADVAFWESMFNLVLAELPITLMCACPSHATRAAEIITQTHPRLRTSAGVGVNSGFREPISVLAEHPASAPPPLVGPPSGEMKFGSPEELAAVRVAVAAHAQAAGLAADRVEDVVLAVCEAATNCVEHGAGHGRLLMWVSGGRLIWEIHDPGRDTGARDLDRHGPKRLGLLAPAADDPRGRGMWISRELSDSLHVWCDGGGTSVRGSATR